MQHKGPLQTPGRPFVFVEFAPPQPGALPPRLRARIAGLDRRGERAQLRALDQGVAAEDAFARCTGNAASVAAAPVEADGGLDRVADWDASGFRKLLLPKGGFVRAGEGREAVDDRSVAKIDPAASAVDGARDLHESGYAPCKRHLTHTASISNGGEAAASRKPQPARPNPAA
jgi:hypothetical protein